MILIGSRGRAHEFGHRSVRGPFHVTNNREPKCNDGEKLQRHCGSCSSPTELGAEYWHRFPPEIGLRWRYINARSSNVNGFTSHADLMPKRRQCTVRLACR